MIKNIYEVYTRGQQYICNEIVCQIPSHTIRLFYYKFLLGVKIGKNSSIAMHVKMLSPNNMSIGDNCAINQSVFLDARGGITIGDNVNIARQVCIYTAAHNLNSPKWEYYEKSISIASNSWIASNAILIPGVEVMEGAVIAAGSVVTKAVEKFTIVGGNPAKKIGERPAQIDYRTNYFPLFA